MLITELRDKTLELLKNRPVWLTLTLIAEETTIPHGWLKVFAQGKISDPSVNRIETLKLYLEAKAKP